MKSKNTFDNTQMFRNETLEVHWIIKYHTENNYPIVESNL